MLFVVHRAICFLNCNFTNQIESMVEQWGFADVHKHFYTHQKKKADDTYLCIVKTRIKNI